MGQTVASPAADQGPVSAMGNVRLKADSDRKHESFLVIGHNLCAVAFPGLYVLSLFPTLFLLGHGADLPLESLLPAVSFIHLYVRSLVCKHLMSLCCLSEDLTRVACMGRRQHYRTLSTELWGMEDVAGAKHCLTAG